ncbi:MAG: hypothetical protein LBD88_00625 [Candidatus Peribacteria bacterium]|jgi:hypothetical protein|nr:hypothetical protein [Candidatus Peribacteria bacterium]
MKWIFIFNHLLMKKIIFFVSLVLLLFNIKTFADVTPELYVVNAYPVSNNMFEIVFSNRINKNSLSSEDSLFVVESLDTSNNMYYNVIATEIDYEEENIVKIILGGNFVY